MQYFVLKYFRLVYNAFVLVLIESTEYTACSQERGIESPLCYLILGSRRVYVRVIRNDVNLDGMVAQRAQDKNNKIMVS